MGFGNFRPHPLHCSKTPQPQLIYVKFEIDSTPYAKFQVLCRRGWSRQIASSSVKVCPFSHLFATESRKLFFVFVPKKCSCCDNRLHCDVCSYSGHMHQLGSEAFTAYEGSSGGVAWVRKDRLQI